MVPHREQLCLLRSYCNGTVLSERRGAGARDSKPTLGRVAALASAHPGVLGKGVGWGALLQSSVWAAQGPSQMNTHAASGAGELLGWPLILSHPLLTLSYQTWVSGAKFFLEPLVLVFSCGSPSGPHLLRRLCVSCSEYRLKSKKDGFLFISSFTGFPEAF